MSIIDLSTKKVTSTIVDINLSRIKHIQGRTYIISRGNYGDRPSKVYQTNGDQHEYLGFSGTHLVSHQHQLIIGGYNYNTGSSSLQWIDPSNNQKVSEVSFTSAEVSTLFGVNSGPDDFLYLCDANGFVSTGSLVFYQNQTIKKKIEVGLNPHSVVFIK